MAITWVAGTANTTPSSTFDVAIPANDNTKIIVIVALKLAASSASMEVSTSGYTDIVDTPNATVNQHVLISARRGDGSSTARITNMGSGTLVGQAFVLTGAVIGDSLSDYLGGSAIGDTGADTSLTLDTGATHTPGDWGVAGIQLAADVTNFVSTASDYTLTTFAASQGIAVGVLTTTQEAATFTWTTSRSRRSGLAIIRAVPVPATITAIGTVGTPTLSASATLMPSTITAIAMVQSPTVLPTSTPTPATITAVGEVLSPTVNTGANETVEPSTITAVGEVLTPTLAVAALPATITAIGEVITPDVTADATVEPATITAIGEVITPAVTGSDTVTPSTITAIGTVSEPTVDASGNVATSTITAIGTVAGIEGLTSSPTVEPSTVTAVGQVGTIQVSTFQPVTPATITAWVSFGAVTISVLEGIQPGCLHLTVTTARIVLTATVESRLVLTAQEC